ncbi:hypothetical protein GUJ93_ZPchr0003g16757 [Zizania palustris]|uniref:Uncharacterized protein n=1 Tax=Zizania palustris TaxID=103762 RepID=A0A8J5VVD9_ZIZPA|nr:hypothetical protein GUJ93_ZPchr0003g16757 [Zizania palustris]
MAERDLESKVAVASELLVSLRAELFARAVDGTLGEEATEKEKPTVSSRAMLDKTKKELKDVKENVDKAKDEVKCLHVVAASLNADLAMQRAELAARQWKGVIAASISSLEEELSRVKSALAAAYGARAEEDVEVAKAGVLAMDTRLKAVKQEILAATIVTLTVEEYDELSQRARETEDVAGNRVTEAVKLIKEAEDAEVRSLEKLVELVLTDGQGKMKKGSSGKTKNQTPCRWA